MSHLRRFAFFPSSPFILSILVFPSKLALCSISIHFHKLVGLRSRADRHHPRVIACDQKGTLSVAALACVGEAAVWGCNLRAPAAVRKSPANGPKPAPVRTHGVPHNPIPPLCMPSAGLCACVYVPCCQCAGRALGAWVSVLTRSQAAQACVLIRDPLFSPETGPTHRARKGPRRYGTSPPYGRHFRV